jgi:hypothetical protein
MVQIKSQHSLLVQIIFHSVNLEEKNMAHYAFINTDNIVVEVITGKDETDTETLPEGSDSWEQYYETQRDGLICKRTSYNTLANQHILDGTPFRGNYAGIGFTYDSENDVFYSEQPYPSWTISEELNWTWTCPVPYPYDGQQYDWNEEDQTWDLVE